MKMAKYIGLLVAVLVCVAGTAQAAPIVVNGNFTSPTPGSGWTQAGNLSGIGLPGGFVNLGSGGVVYQMTSQVVTLGESYQVSWRAMPTDEGGLVGKPTIQLYYGEFNVITEDTVTVPLPTYSWSSYDFTYTPTVGSLGLGQTLGIRFDAIEWTGIGNVEINVIPEPGTLLLAGVGLLGLVGGRRRRAVAA